MVDGGVEGIDAARVTGWFRANVPGARPPLAFAPVPHGHSNLTFVVADAAGERWVLRRPPLAMVLATAHDVLREHRIVSALARTPVPVPPAVAACEDPAVTGAPFFVMGFVDGHVLRDRAGAEAALSEPARAAVAASLVSALAALHRVDPEAVGLGGLRRPGGYVERQLRRWQAQVEQERTRALPGLDELHRRLVERTPPERETAIVHGDFRLDNAVVGDDGSVRAVLDWELCAVGDPLADLGLMVVYWGERPGGPQILGDAARAAGFPPSARLVEDYARESGRDVSGVGFHVAFGYWKLACILEGVWTRYAAGAMGRREDVPVEGMAALVTTLADLGLEALDRLG